MKSLPVQTSHSKKEKGCRGFRNPDNTTQAKNKNRKSNENNHTKTYRNNALEIIKKTDDQYNDLKKIETLLRIHAQANSTLEQVYRGLYTISREEENHKEAMEWAQKWVTIPSENKESAWKQAQVANKLKDLKSLQKVTRALISLNSQKAIIAMQWCIKHLLIAENWEEAYRTIKRLKRMNHSSDITAALEATCIIELQRIPQREKIRQINRLGISDANSQNKIYKIVQTRYSYEKGENTNALKIEKSDLSVNKNGAGIERLLLPVLLHTNQTESATRLCKELLTLNQSAKELKNIYGECLLRKGEWRTGFEEKSTYQTSILTIHKKPCTAIYCNGTLGETLFYSRWLSCLKHEKNKRTVYAQQPLIKLLQFNFKHIDFLPLKNINHHIKYKHLPITLLPTEIKDWERNGRLFNFTLSTEESIEKNWREEIKKEPGEKLIAINWHGPALKLAHKTSKSDIDLESFACLTKEKHIKFVSLQKGTGKEELKHCSFKDFFHEYQGKINNENRIEHIAAIIATCDAVICDDSGPAHLASNLGKTTLFNTNTDCSWIWQQTTQKNLRFYPKSETSNFVNSWEETILLGWEKLQLF